MLDRWPWARSRTVLHEAQRLDDPGLTLKALHDLHPHDHHRDRLVEIFHLRNRVTDALTGRYLYFLMLSFSRAEALAVTGALADPALRQPTADALLPDALLYGLYPEVDRKAAPRRGSSCWQSWSRAICSASILTFHRIRFSQVIVDLACALAYQIGNEVNESELATRPQGGS